MQRTIFLLEKDKAYLDMATSESDGDFESADEELGRSGSSKRDTQTTYWTSPTTVDSESDDDTEYVQHMPYRSFNSQKKNDIWITSLPDVSMSLMTTVSNKDKKTDSNVKVESNVHKGKSVCLKKIPDNQEDASILVEANKSSTSISAMENKDTTSMVGSNKKNIAKSKDIPKAEITRFEEFSRTSQRNSTCQLNAKKLGTKITKYNIDKPVIMNKVIAEQDVYVTKHLSEEPKNQTANKDAGYRLQNVEEISTNQSTDNQLELQNMEDNLQEIDMPDELKSDKKFKEVFQPEGWEGLGSDIELPDELTEEKLQPILERLTLASKEPENSSETWSNWGNWDVTSLINTATAGVSTLTNHVSQGLTLFESTTEVVEPTEVTRTKQDATPGGMISSISLNIQKIFVLIFCPDNINYLYIFFYYSYFPYRTNI